MRLRCSGSLVILRLPLAAPPRNPVTIISSQHVVIIIRCAQKDEEARLKRRDIVDNIPSSPPKNNPPAEAKKYVAKSPSVVGLSKGVRSGMDSACMSERNSKRKKTEERKLKKKLTLAAVRKNQMRGLLLRAECLEEGSSRAAEPEGDV